MTGTPSGRRRRVAALLPIVPAMAAATVLASSGGDTAGRPEACSSLDQLKNEMQLGLTVSPGNPEAGDVVTVHRTDRHTMDFGPLMLYGDVDAGCRTFALMFDADGPSWEEETNKTEFGFGGLVNPSARTEQYELPGVAEHGTYLLCALGGATVCADVTI